MTAREDTIERIERVLELTHNNSLTVTIPRLTAERAVAMLKEREVATIKKTKEHGFGVYGGICPKCHNWIQSAHSFCGFCGQAVKWV